MALNRSRSGCHKFCRNFFQPFPSHLLLCGATMSSDSFELQFSIGALPLSRDRGRPLGLPTATGLRAGRSIPSQPPMLLARGERRSVRDTQGSRDQRARKQAQAFWWGALSALGALGLIAVQTDNPVTECWRCTQKGLLLLSSVELQ